MMKTNAMEKIWIFVLKNKQSSESTEIIIILNNFERAYGLGNPWFHENPKSAVQSSAESILLTLKFIVQY